MKLLYLHTKKILSRKNLLKRRKNLLNRLINFLKRRLIFAQCNIAFLRCNKSTATCPHIFIILISKTVLYAIHTIKQGLQPYDCKHAISKLNFN